MDESDGAVDRRGSHERPVRRAQHDRHEFIAVLDLTDQDELVSEGFEWVDERYEVRLLLRVGLPDDRCERACGHVGDEHLRDRSHCGEDVDDTVWQVHSRSVGDRSEVRDRDVRGCARHRRTPTDDGLYRYCMSPSGRASMSTRARPGSL